MKRGFFISFEGGEGAGKSVQTELLVNRLRQAGYEVLVTREPGGTRIGEQIRAITHNQENVDLTAIAEAYLMSASRAQHIAEIIEPALTDGKIVVCDRFLDSSLAYQGYGRNLGEETIERLNKLAVDGTIPDLTFLLEVLPVVGLSRRSKDAKIDRLDLQQKDFYQRVHDGYLALAKKYRQRYVVIEADKSIEVVASLIWKTVSAKLTNRNGQKA